MAGEISLYWRIDCDFQDGIFRVLADEALEASEMMGHVLRETQRSTPLRAFVFNHQIMDSCTNIVDGVARFWRDANGYDVHALVKVMGFIRVSELTLGDRLLAAIDKSVNEHMSPSYAEMFKCWKFTSLTEEQFLEMRSDDYEEAMAYPNAIERANAICDGDE